MLPHPKLNDLVNEKQVKGAKKTTAQPESTTMGKFYNTNNKHLINNLENF